MLWLLKDGVKFVMLRVYDSSINLTTVRNPVNIHESSSVRAGMQPDEDQDVPRLDGPGK